MVCISHQIGVLYLGILFTFTELDFHKNLWEIYSLYDTYRVDLPPYIYIYILRLPTWELHAQQIYHIRLHSLQGYGGA